MSIRLFILVFEDPLPLVLWMEVFDAKPFSLPGDSLVVNGEVSVEPRTSL